MKAKEIKFTGANGVSLPGIIWYPLCSPTMVVQITHGMTEHIGRYEQLAEYLTSYGIAVAGFDLRGHGHNPGDNQCASFGEGGWNYALHDMHLFYLELNSKFPNIPHFMLGFSLGSFLLRDYLNRYCDKVDGAIIMGTGHQPGAVLNMLMPVVKREIKANGFDSSTHKVNKLSFETYNQKFAPNMTSVDLLCSDTTQRIKYRGDPLCRKTISAGLSGVTFVDVTSALVSNNDQALFYRTDHHWTSLGAYHAFTELAPQLGLEAPDLSAYDVYTVSNTFEGTLSSKSGSHGTADTVQIFVPQTEIEYYVTYNQDSATDICSMYKREALDQKDHYTVFFGGNYSRVDITTTADTGRSLLIFKDSYANCFVQFLYPYFDHITMIDPRYYYDNVENVMRSEAITDVLYLYNLDTFLGDTSLADTLATGN